MLRHSLFFRFEYNSARIWNEFEFKRYLTSLEVPNRLSIFTVAIMIYVFADIMCRLIKNHEQAFHSYIVTEYQVRH